MITGAAQGVVADLHDRMPIVVAPDAYDRWLDPDEQKSVDLLKPDSAELVAHPVNPAVNSPKNDDPRCVDPFDGGQERNLELFR